MTESELAQARAKLISGVSIEQLAHDLRGKPYRRLVEAQMRRFRTELPTVIAASIELLTPNEKGIAERIIDNLNSNAHERAFWTSDAANILSSISRELTDACFPEAADPAGIFDIFQLVTAHFAWMAYEQKNFRKSIGIRCRWFRR